MRNNKKRNRRIAIGVLATRSGVLEMTTAYGVRPKKYALSNNSDVINAYATPESEEEAEPEAAPAQSEAAAESGDVYAALTAAVTAVIAAGKKPNNRNVKKQLKDTLPDFDEKKLASSSGKSFRKFKDFVTEAVSRGAITVDMDGKTEMLGLPGAQEEAPAAVEEAESAPVAEAEAPTQEQPQESSDEATADPLADAYATLVSVVEAAVAEGKSTGARALQTRFKKIEPPFDVKALNDTDGAPFKSVNAFLQAAAAAGQIKVEGEGSKLKALLND